MSDDDLRTVTIDELHAYVDGELPAERVPAVEARLAGDADAAERVRDYRVLSAALRRAVATGGDADAPSTVLPFARPRPGRFGRGAVRPTALAAGLALALMVGGATGWVARGPGSFGDPAAVNGLAERTEGAFRVYARDERHPVEMTDPVRLADWLSTRMNTAVRIPDLARDGFGFVGGRLMVGEVSPAALLMYEDAAKNRVVIYWRNDLPQGRPTPMRQGAETGPVSVVYWRDAEAGFGVAGEMPGDRLKRLADRIREQISL